MVVLLLPLRRFSSARQEERQNRGRARLRALSVLTHYRIRVTRGLQSPTNSPRSSPPWFKLAIFVRLNRQRHSFIIFATLQLDREVGTLVSTILDTSLCPHRHPLIRG